jgi:hypothetical protein
MACCAFASAGDRDTQFRGGGFVDCELSFLSGGGLPIVPCEVGPGGSGGADSWGASAGAIGAVFAGGGGGVAG